jgi:transketolase
LNTSTRKLLYNNLLTLHYKTSAGHIGSSLSCLDMMSELILFQMKGQDKFILSKGHAVPALYVILNKKGSISDTELQTFYSNGTKLPAHPPLHLHESIPFASGSLGHGLSLSCGLAQGLKYLSLKSNNTTPWVYCLISDGECNEGQVWEAAQYASAKKINNLVVLIDKNKLQAFGKTKNVLGDGATAARWKAFGFETYLCDGHNLNKLQEIFKVIKKSPMKKPKVVICSTVKGYGVSFMEDKMEWHYHKLTEKLYKKALLSVEKKLKNQ